MSIATSFGWWVRCDSEGYLGQLVGAFKDGDYLYWIIETDEGTRIGKRWTTSFVLYPEREDIDEAIPVSDDDDEEEARVAKGDVLQMLYDQDSWCLKEALTAHDFEDALGRKRLDRRMKRITEYFGTQYLSKKLIGSHGLIVTDDSKKPYRYFLNPFMKKQVEKTYKTL